MDRNVDTQNLCVCVIVALRKESVDRNQAQTAAPAALSVALRKESVDRNGAAV